RRVSPPQNRGSSFPEKALQSYPANALSSGASTTNTNSTGGTQTARIACHSIGLPASAWYCFGPSPAMRVPVPAAGIKAKTAKGKVLGNSKRYNCTLFRLMHRDSISARRRIHGLAGSADALALARLASQEKPLAIISATALDGQRLLEEIRW